MSSNGHRWLVGWLLSVVVGKVFFWYLLFLLAYIEVLVADSIKSANYSKHLFLRIYIIHYAKAMFHIFLHTQICHQFWSDQP